ncbi:iron uptake porin [Spirulina sp. CS-785/01]|uniref:iron uptake porin n=1 Tax=Spirulina sp. CS-785/01 TaxID=3021716 RepID=UPI00232D8C4F|nr:iron uptake porin [Spirulina sp. CS-785/01]MDB9312119.1 iron uptake porin [Spirulina sp. CS-785/01]
MKSKSPYFILFLSPLFALTTVIAQAQAQSLESPNLSSNPSENTEQLTNLTLPLTTIADIQQNTTRSSPITDSNPIDFSNTMGQMTNVFELRDVDPATWAYSALASLIERYNCLAGYPDGTFRGNFATSRYEFAAGLNACLQQMERLIATDEYVTEEDLNILQRLKQEYDTELRVLGTKTDNLESRVSFLEDNQFSTTVRFGGQATFAVSFGGGGDPPGTGVAEPIFNYNSKIGIVTALTPLDRLRIAFEAGNFENIAFAGPNSLNTRTALLSFQTGTSNQLQLSSLEYRTAALDNRVVFTIKPFGFQLSDILTANSAYFDSSRGAISRFAEASPVFKIGAPDAGLGFDWLISDSVRFQAAYGFRNANDGEVGIFKSDHSVLGLQFLMQPTSNLVTGVTYVNGYSRNGRLDTFTGSFNADTSGQFFSFTPIQIHALNGTVQWRVAPNVTLGAWGGLIYSRGLGVDETTLAVTKTYLFSVGIADPFGREGDLFAILGGQPPKLFAGTGPVPEDPGSSLHLEAFYNFQVNDHLSISPGVFMVTNPGNIPENNTIFVGTLRATLRF